MVTCLNPSGIMGVYPNNGPYFMIAALIGNYLSRSQAGLVIILCENQLGDLRVNHVCEDT